MNYDNPYLDDEKDLKAANKMDEISNTIFAPIYPVIAGQIIKKFNITAGNCIDIGSGPASLSIAIASITRLGIHAMDASKHSFKIAKRNIEARDLLNRVTPVVGNVEEMPFEDDFAELIISRGSVFFWEDLVKAFNEIYRVLKPGGQTYIGGGFGTPELQKIIFEKMAQRDKNFKNRLHPKNKNRIKDAIEHSDIPTYAITQGDGGFWIHITKE